MWSAFIFAVGIIWKENKKHRLLDLGLTKWWYFVMIHLKSHDHKVTWPILKCTGHHFMYYYLCKKKTCNKKNKKHQNSRNTPKSKKSMLVVHFISHYGISAKIFMQHFLAKNKKIRKQWQEKCCKLQCFS